MSDRATADTDGGWREIIAEFAEEFFAFYFPDIHAAIDFGVEPKFLDAILAEIVPESEVGAREADKLVEVRLKGGGTEWLLVHIEVQGYRDADFARRMFIYNYRIFDRYGRDVISLAVLTDGDPAFRPSEYRRELLGFSLRCTYPVVKLLDYRPEQLAASRSPFAIVTQTQLDYLAAGSDPQKRYGARLAITLRLFRQGFSREEVVRLYRFLGYVLRLPPDLAIQYRQAVHSIEEDLKMPYITDTELLARQEGQREGRLQGRLQGRRQGQREGALRGLREAVLDALTARFGDIPYQVREAVNHADSGKELKRLHRLAVTVRSLDAFPI